MPLSPGEFKDTATISESIEEVEVLHRVVPRTHVVEQLPSHVDYQQTRSLRGRFRVRRRPTARGTTTIGLPAPRQAAKATTSPCLGLTPDEPLVSSRTQDIPFSHKPCLPVLAGHRAVANGCPVFRGTQVLKAVLHVAALLHAHNLLDVLCMSHKLHVHAFFFPPLHRPAAALLA
jgi:hypothetical protein